MPVSREQVIYALKSVREPELYKDIVALGMVKDIEYDGDAVLLGMEFTSPSTAVRDAVLKDVKAALAKIGVSDVRVSLTGAEAGASPGAAAGSAPAAEKKHNPLPHVKNVIAVGAGKGGVGKSTLALNLAIGLARNGAAVGVLDGDIYGPSMPTLLGVRGRAADVRGNKIIPFFVHGVHAVTIGSVVEIDKPLIWRGPMAHGAFKQLLIDNTEWPDLDYLIVDLPPGTGDVPLTLCQLLPLKGAVVVATPQQVALDDAIRAVAMFQQLGAPILGMVENMSYFVGPNGEEHDIFGRGGTVKCAAKLGLPFLGDLPMFTELRVNSDAGTPNKNFEGSPKLKESLEHIVNTLAAEVDKRNQSPAGPTLNII